MHPAPDRLHDHCGNQVAGDCSEWLDLEQQDEDRRHQGAAAHPGEPDGESHEEPG
jgi:hypothetical protein